MEGSVGVITGKFAPLHSGHIYAITQASTQVETLYVILSYDEKFINEQPDYLKDKLTLKKRLLWLRTTFSNLPHIKILYVDETSINSYPNGAEEWSDAVKGVLSESGVQIIDKWFSSEPEYDWWIKKYFNCEHVVLDDKRSYFNISATQIRENPYQFWEFLPTVVRKEFLLKVVVIGTESSAKSTLTKYLAKMFNTSWVEEYGRTYCEDTLCGDETLLSFHDYALIASNRYYQECQSCNTANKILFVDTNAFVTQYYCELYEGKKNSMVDAYIELEDYDLVLHLSDEVKWVDDGLRINNDRDTTSKLFNKMLDEYGIKCQDNYQYITGNYEQRLTKAVNIVSDKLKRGK